MCGFEMCGNKVASKLCVFDSSNYSYGIWKSIYQNSGFVLHVWGSMLKFGVIFLDDLNVGGYIF